MARRVLLLVFALTCWAAGVGLLGIQVFGAASEGAQAFSLPERIPGTDLVALELAAYDGPFLEDGSGDEVVEIAGLLLENQGSALIEAAQVELHQGGRILRFAIRYLPPGGRVLALELGRRAFSMEPVTACQGSAILASEGPWGISIRETGMRTLQLTLSAEEPVAGATLYYKNWDPESGIYLGGIAYELTVGQMLPGRTYTCCPSSYLQGESKILYIRTSGS